MTEAANEQLKKELREQTRKEQLQRKLSKNKKDKPTK